MEKQLAQFQATLAASGEDFMLLSPLPKDIVHARFSGCFEGREVVWDMFLYTLVRYAQELRKLPLAPSLALRGLMYIEPGVDQLYPLKVALNVPLIDVPTLKKTITMMRNYRQLRLGLHTWGAAVEPSENQS